MGAFKSAFYFGFGALLAYAGNFTPKMPALPDKWLGASGFAKAYRFAGWVFMLGGILMCLTALIVPIEQIQAVGAVDQFTNHPGYVGRHDQNGPRH